MLRGGKEISLGPVPGSESEVPINQETHVEWVKRS